MARNTSAPADTPEPELTAEAQAALDAAKAAVPVAPETKPEVERPSDPAAVTSKPINTLAGGFVVRNH